MKFTDLEPEFHRYVERMDSDPRVNDGAQVVRLFLQEVESLEEAQGVWFLCPGCFAKNGGKVGTHMVDVSFQNRGVPDHLGSQNREGKPSRWQASGTGLADLTLSPSVDCGCWHGHVINGEAV